jgi:hypothetical protein
MNDDGTIYEGTDEARHLTWRISLSDGQLVLAVENQTGPLRQLAHWLDKEATAAVSQSLVATNAALVGGA